MELVVKDKLVGKRVGRAFAASGSLASAASTLNTGPNTLHRDECGGHAASRAQEPPPIEAEPASGLVGELLEPGFDLALIRGLGQGIELAVGDHLRRHRRGERRFFGRRQVRKLTRA